MKYSQQPFHTSKTVNSDLTAKNARLLTQAGYIHQEIAGVYSFLPLGLRVLNKIEKIIREEMDTVAVEILLTSLAPQEKWQQTGRLDTVDVLMKTQAANAASLAKNGTEYVLNSTHEEIVTPLLQEFISSYRSFPAAVYQIQTKFRNEPRAKSGLLRCREFRMKDGYSFHTSEADLKKNYEEMKKVYTRIFDRLGLGADTVVALASGGDFTPDFSHEFQTICAAGEDVLFMAKKAGMVFNREVAPAQALALDDSNEEMLPMEEVLGEGLIGVAALAKFLGISTAKTTKTMLFETDKGEIVAAAVRGGYDIHEEKLKKILGCNEIHLASAEIVQRVTHAEVGYAGVLNLPPEVRLLFDESTKDRKNFECGANRTHYHTKNVNWGRDIPVPKEFYDFKVAREGDRYPETGEAYEVVRACEVGNIFPLNTKFSKAFGFSHKDEKGEEQPVYMGCYGIGPSRVMGVLVEKYADDKGLFWPRQVAPFQVHLIDINSQEKGQEIYVALQKAGVEVFWDDRDVRAGEKFADADLMGMPFRVVVSQKTGEQVELKKRNLDEAQLITIDQLITEAKTAGNI